MGAWYLSLVVSLLLILIGMYIHWSVVLAGLLLPFVPMIAMVRKLRRKRAGDDRADTEPGS